MPKFVIRTNGATPVLHIDTQDGDEFTAEEASVWMQNEIRGQIASVEDRLSQIENWLSHIYTAMPG